MFFILKLPRFVLIMELCNLIIMLLTYTLHCDQIDRNIP